MTPFAAAGGRAFVNFVNRDILIVDGDYGLDDGFGRPVVSLSSDAISGGKGTMNDPFTVG